MKEYDRVKLIVEKEKYAKDGAHKDMEGWICDPRNIDGQWLVCFDECELEQFPTIPVKENDLEVVWELPLLQVGAKVLLFVDIYEDKGLSKGLKGTIIAIGTSSDEWLVRFPIQDGLNKETDFVIKGDCLFDLSLQQ